MPRRSPAFAIRSVTPSSSRLGVGSPLGWLCEMMIAAPDAASAGRKTSRGCTRLAVRMPRETTSSATSRFRESSTNTRKTSNFRSLAAGAAKANTAEGESKQGRGSIFSSSRRRPSSNAAKTVPACRSSIPSRSLSSSTLMRASRVERGHRAGPVEARRPPRTDRASRSRARAWVSRSSRKKGRAPGPARPAARECRRRPPRFSRSTLDERTRGP